MNKEETFKKICEDTLPSINTWEDLYTMVDQSVLSIRSNPSQQNVLDALFSMYAFIKAMQALPEEGDIKVLVEKMLRNIILDSKEVLGIETEVMWKDATETDKRAVAMDIAKAMSGVVNDIAHKKPHLH